MSTIKNIAANHELRLTDRVTEQPEVIFIGDSCMGTLGNFSASTGKAKSKKTFNVTAMVAAALLNGEQVLNYRVRMPQDKRTVAYFDTEQSRFHCMKVLRRIARLTRQPLQHHPEHLKFVALRDLSPQQRIAVIEEVVTTTPDLGLVIIDGVRDLMYDINAPKEATEVIGKLMEWTGKYNLHIHTVLHLNKSDDHARGHIGTELCNKAETVLQITRHSSDSSISTVAATFIRSKDFEPFAFCINDAGLPQLTTLMFSNPETGKIEPFPYTELSAEQHREALDIAFADGPIRGVLEIEQALKKAYAQTGFRYPDRKVKQLKTFLTNKRLIVRGEDRAWRINPYYTF